MDEDRKTCCKCGDSCDEEERSTDKNWCSCSCCCCCCCRESDKQ